MSSQSSFQMLQSVRGELRKSLVLLIRARVKHASCQLAAVTDSATAPISSGEPQLHYVAPQCIRAMYNVTYPNHVIHQMPILLSSASPSAPIPLLELQLLPLELPFFLLVASIAEEPLYSSITLLSLSLFALRLLGVLA